MLAFTLIITSQLLGLTQKYQAFGQSIPNAPTTLTGSDATSYSANCAALRSACPFANTGKCSSAPETKLLLTEKLAVCVYNYCFGAPMTYGSCDDSSCCNGGNPQACLISANLQDACLQLEGEVVLCNASASCLCYSKGTYAPQSFDNLGSSCAEIALSAHPNISRLLTGSQGALGLCTRAFGPANTTASTAGATSSVTSMISSMAGSSASTTGVSNSDSRNSGFLTLFRHQLPRVQLHEERVRQSFPFSLS